MIRRGRDVAVAAVVLSTTAPLWLVIAIAIKVDSRGPVLHRAVRVGRDGGLFTLYKFRTMTADATRNGLALTRSGDQRITWPGRFLRSSKLDELPQLLNVLRGDMTLVGPRPEDPRYVSSYTPEQRRILKFKPGITSPASVAYRDEEAILGRCPEEDVERLYVQQVLPSKLDIDLAYCERRSVGTDIAVLARTAARIVRREQLGREARGVTHHGR
jgi:lipopolysaccharide/colanic/teichoic acid biosynthesis glycosyltransferase